MTKSRMRSPTTAPREAPGAPIQIDVGAFSEAPLALITEAVTSALVAEGRPATEISVALLGDEDMRELNRRYLDEDATTDVLAFALDDGGDVIGDVYIGIEQARRQAGDLGVTLDEELARLAIHGTLHVLGHDHPEGPERDLSPMFRLQERLLRNLLAARPSSSP